MTTKITDHHLSREACIYLRQSTPGQVRLNRESTERQYQLSAKARELGWPPERIRILDRDLGQSSSTARDDFKTLVNDVAMGQVGAVFALEASRLGLPSDWGCDAGQGMTGRVFGWLGIKDGVGSAPGGNRDRWVEPKR